MSSLFHLLEGLLSFINNFMGIAVIRRMIKH